MKLEPDDPEGHRARVAAERHLERGSAVPEPALLHKWQNAAYDTAIRVLEEEASHCAAVAADEKDWLPARAAAFEKSETMKRCVAIIRTLKQG